MDELDPVALQKIALVFTHGAEKYGKGNYKKGMEWSRLYAATLRHLTSWFSGEDLDPETGYNHVYHAMATLFMLASYIEKGDVNDDRNT